MPKTIITLESIVAQSSDLVGSNIDGQTALLSIQNGSYYGLDPVGSRVWELIAQPQRVAAVCDGLLAEYTVERTLCEQHVLKFLQQIADAGLLRVMPES